MPNPQGETIPRWDHFLLPLLGIKAPANDAQYEG